MQLTEKNSVAKDEIDFEHTEYLEVYGAREHNLDSREIN